jgi:hypothetical protein
MPEMWSRWMLNETIALLGEQVGEQSHLAQSLQESLQEAMRQAPLAKPDDHRGGPATDMFELSLDSAEVGEIVAVIEQAIQRETKTSGGRSLGGFGEAWQEFQRQVSRNEEGSDI